MIQGPAIQYYYQLSTERNTVRRAVRVSILVGIILNLINHPEVFLSDFSALHTGRVVLTFLVPYLVSTYSSVLTGSSLKPGKVSQIDALLKCKGCKESNFSVNVGQAIEPCPTCKKMTRWKITKLFSDGYQDQFGGDRDKKYSQQGLKELIVRTDPLSLDRVSESIQQEFDQWKRDNEQVDDVLVVGIEFG